MVRVVVQASLHLLSATGLSEKLVAHHAPEHLLQLFFPSLCLLETGLGLWGSCKLDSSAEQEPSIGSSRVLLTPIASPMPSLLLPPALYVTTASHTRAPKDAGTLDFHSVSYTPCGPPIVPTAPIHPFSLEIVHLRSVRLDATGDPVQSGPRHLIVIQARRL